MVQRLSALLWLAPVALQFFLPAKEVNGSDAVLKPGNRKDTELLWHSYVPNYMEKFFSDVNGSINYVSEDLGINNKCARDVSAWIRQLANFRKNPLETETWALHSKRKIL